MALQKGIVNGVACVVDSSDTSTPISDVTGDGGDIVASNAALLAGNTFLRSANNLSEVASTSTARANLGLSALATTTPATGVATFLATPSSSNLKAAVTDETGSGSLVFGTDPTFTTRVQVPDGTSSTLGVAFAGETTTGFYRRFTGVVTTMIGGAAIFETFFVSGTAGIRWAASCLIGWGSTNADSSFDTTLKRPSAGTIQARNGDDTGFSFMQGKLQTHANAVTETITPNKTIVIYDAAGQAYRVPCQV